MKCFIGWWLGWIGKFVTLFIDNSTCWVFLVRLYALFFRVCFVSVPII